MGCDIHLHVEFKVTGMWQHYSQPEIGRDYQLFAKMANVRNNSSIAPISLPKGLPSDLSFATMFNATRDGENYHSHSYLTQEEIKQLTNWYFERAKINNIPGYYHQVFGYFFGNEFACTSSTPKDVEDVRFVFWFDN